MDGLLIDSEDRYTICTNAILHEYGRPSLPWSIKAQLQGRPGPEAGKIFHDWAQLPISIEEFMAKQSKLQQEHFPHCKPLPGVERLIQRLKKMEKGEGKSGRKVHMAVATSSHVRNYRIKTENLTELFGLFPKRQIVLGDDTRIGKGRGKPLPDIYLLALKTINDSLREQGSESEITPEECLVFEDSVPGVEAGRRAGMRVVWAPHPGLREQYEEKEKEVLAGRMGEHKEDEANKAGADGVVQTSGNVGELDDGWAEMLITLEDFDFEKYGID
ncbi:MAG: hypothetical protein Q9227_006136 [Pyrenula ochraceoflavens]